MSAHLSPEAMATIQAANALPALPGEHHPGRPPARRLAAHRHLSLQKDRSPLRRRPNLARCCGPALPPAAHPGRACLGCLQFPAHLGQHRRRIRAGPPRPAGWRRRAHDRLYQRNPGRELGAQRRQQRRTRPTGPGRRLPPGPRARWRAAAHRRG